MVVLLSCDDDLMMMAIATAIAIGDTVSVD